jgi:hypothetical protein
MLKTRFVGLNQFPKNIVVRSLNSLLEKERRLRA